MRISSGHGFIPRCRIHDSIRTRFVKKYLDSKGGAIHELLQLNSSVFDLHVYFFSRYDGPLYKQFRGQQDICHVSLAGTLCASSSPKVKLAIPVNITMETSEDTTCSVGFSVRKDKGNLYCYVKKEYFFHLCDCIKNGSIKYLELSGEEFSRGSATIGSIDFMSSLSDTIE